MTAKVAKFCRTRGNGTTVTKPFDTQSETDSPRRSIADLSGFAYVDRSLAALLAVP